MERRKTTHDYWGHIGSFCLGLPAHPLVLLETCHYTHTHTYTHTTHTQAAASTPVHYFDATTTFKKKVLSRQCWRESGLERVLLRSALARLYWRSCEFRHTHLPPCEHIWLQKCEQNLQCQVSPDGHCEVKFPAHLCCGQPPPASPSTDCRPWWAGFGGGRVSGEGHLLY